MKQQKIFKKGSIYVNDSKDIYILCTQTTCSYTSRLFKGVVVLSTYKDVKAGDEIEKAYLYYDEYLEPLTIGK